MVDLPRNGYVQPVEGISGAIPIAISITGMVQVQNEETVAPLGAGASVVSAGRDCINYESYGISIFLDPAAGQALNCTVLVENSATGAGGSWRQVDSVSVSGAADAAKTLNRVYAVCREFYRVTVTNNDGSNALDATEVVSMLKPI